MSYERDFLALRWHHFWCFFSFFFNISILPTRSSLSVPSFVSSVHPALRIVLCVVKIFYPHFRLWNSIHWQMNANQIAGIFIVTMFLAPKLKRKIPRFCQCAFLLNLCLTSTCEILQQHLVGDIIKSAHLLCVRICIACLKRQWTEY